MPQKNTPLTWKLHGLLSLFLVTGCMSLVSLSWRADAAPKDANWKERYLRAQELIVSGSEESFRELTELLKDTHVDVSYAASLSLAARGQTVFLDSLIQACRGLPREHKWFAYKMLGSYPDRRTLSFLAEMMADEFHTMSADNTIFDDRNYWYIEKSIQAILADLGFDSKLTKASDSRLDIRQMTFR